MEKQRVLIAMSHGKDMGRKKERKWVKKSLSLQFHLNFKLFLFTAPKNLI